MNENRGICLMASPFTGMNFILRVFFLLLLNRDVRKLEYE